MSDKTDPVLGLCPYDSMHRADWEMGGQSVYCYDCENSHPPSDDAAGVVRVDTRDEALVERLAEVLGNTVCTCPAESQPFFGGLCSRCDVRAVLAALREES